MIENRITPKSFVARDSHVASRLMGGEMMIMSTRDSTLFTLNSVATAIWEAADGSTPLDEIIANRVCQEFDVSQELAMKDAEALVQQLADHGILIVSDQAISPRAMAQVNAK
ncbi:MAG TPA: PqqD family protein [Candidatus Acidoferrum sp.]|nr:PqqD family protein [Candidatus Acidoferrum sp.]